MYKKVIFAIMMLCFLISRNSSAEESFWKKIMNDSKQPRFVVVLLDESGSFKLKNEDFWPQILVWTGKIVDRLEPGEGIAVIGIDGHGFDADDIIVEADLLDENVLKAVQKKRKIIQKIKGLCRRSNTPPYTDIMGALHQAANILTGETGYQQTIVIFSDMIQTPRPPQPKDAAKLKFDNNTKIHCFYVNATKGNTGRPGHDSWEKLLNTWIPIFQIAGLNYKKEDGTHNFVEKGKTKIVFNRVFPPH